MLNRPKTMMTNPYPTGEKFNDEVVNFRRDAAPSIFDSTDRTLTMDVRSNAVLTATKGNQPKPIPRS